MTDSFKGEDLLSPEQNLFGRVLIRNGLATKEQVEAAARDATNGPAESLEEAVVSRGVMSASTVEMVKSAIERKLQERGLSTASFAPPGASGVLDPVKRDQLCETPHDAKDDEERLRRLVKRIVPSRFHMRLLDHVLADGMGVLFAEELSKRLGADARRIVRVLREWKAHRFVETTSGFKFMFSPTHTEREDMRRLMKMWTNQRTHAKVLGWILHEEFG